MVQLDRYSESLLQESRMQLPEPVFALTNHMCLCDQHGWWLAESVSLLGLDFTVVYLWVCWLKISCIVGDLSRVIAHIRGWSCSWHKPSRLSLSLSLDHLEQACKHSKTTNSAEQGGYT